MQTGLPGEPQDGAAGPWDPAQQPSSQVGQRWKFMDDGKLRKVPGRNLFAEPSSNMRSGTQCHRQAKVGSF